MGCAALVVFSAGGAAFVTCALGTRDEDVGAAGVELDGEDLLGGAGSHFHGAIVLLVEIGGLDLISEIFGDLSRS